VKYKQYILTFSGDDSEALKLLRQRINSNQSRLRTARELGNAAKLLFGVDFEIESVTRASERKD